MRERGKGYFHVTNKFAERRERCSFGVILALIVIGQHMLIVVHSFVILYS